MYLFLDCTYRISIPIKWEFILDNLNWTT